jgi:uncharacterized protein (DUF58 family)
MDETPDQLLQRLEWTVLRRLDGLLQGDHRTLWRGSGLDLADLREYQPGDDVRHIDWNVTARLQQPHVRQYTEDRDLTAWFVLDLSASLNFGSDARSKRALSEAFVAALARLLSRHGNRVGAIVYGQQVEAVLPPRVGRSQVLQLLARMRQRPARPAPRSAATDTRLGELLQQAEGLMRRRALVFVVSDFISAPGWQAPLGRLARRHDVMAVRVVDPLEMALPPLGLLTVEDAETGEQLLVDSQDPAFRSRYEDAALAHEAAIYDGFAQAGVDALELATNDDLLASLLRCAVLRRQRQRLPLPRRLPAALRLAAPFDGQPTLPAA